jgi:hypothetical protein
MHPECEQAEAADALAVLRGAAATIDQFEELYGDRWQLEPHPELGVYMALRRRTVSSEHVLVAHTVAELAVKVAAADQRSGDEPR